jgi:ribosome biogenesis GTPase
LRKSWPTNQISLTRKLYFALLGAMSLKSKNNESCLMKNPSGKDFLPHHRKDKPDYRRQACREPFTCKVCGMLVVPGGAGTEHRNHCPNCLSSVHVDNDPGDRAADCGAVMEPIGVWVRKNGEWAIIHRCRLCGTLSSNRIAADDNPTLLMSIAVKPLASPPFPLGLLEQRFSGK